MRQGTHWRAPPAPRREPIDRVGWAIVGLVGAVLVLAVAVLLMVRGLG